MVRHCLYKRASLKEKQSESQTDKEKKGEK